MSPFPTVFSNLLGNSLPLSSNLELSSANSFSLAESKICHFGKGLIHLRDVSIRLRKLLLNPLTNDKF